MAKWPPLVVSCQSAAVQEPDERPGGDGDPAKEDQAEERKAPRCPKRRQRVHGRLAEGGYAATGGAKADVHRQDLQKPAQGVGQRAAQAADDGSDQPHGGTPAGRLLRAGQRGGGGSGELAPSSFCRNPGMLCCRILIGSQRALHEHFYCWEVGEFRWRSAAIQGRGGGCAVSRGGRAATAERPLLSGHS